MFQARKITSTYYTSINNKKNAPIINLSINLLEGHESSPTYKKTKTILWIRAKIYLIQ